MINHNKKNKLIIIAILSFWLVVVLVLPTKAQERDVGCCEVTKGEATHRYTGTRNECTESNRNGYTSHWEGNKIARVPDGDMCVDKDATMTTTEPSTPITFTPQISIPGSDFISGQGVELPASARIIAKYIVAILRYLIGVAGIVSAIVLMVAGVRWLTAGGNSTAVGEAKKYVLSSLTGLGLTLGSFLLLSIVSTNLVELKIPDVKYVKYQSLESLSDEDFDRLSNANIPASFPDTDPFPQRLNLLENNKLTEYKYEKKDLIKKLFYIYPVLAISGPRIKVELHQQCGAPVTDRDYSMGCKCTERYRNGDPKKTDNIACTHKDPNNYSTICTSGCALVSTFMILNAYKKNTLNFKEQIDDMARFMETKYRVCNAGSVPTGLLQYMKSKGLKSESLGTLKNAAPYLKKGYPVLASIKTASGGGHYIVLHWQEGDTIHVKDPIKQSPNTMNVNNININTGLWLFYDGNKPDTNEYIERWNYGCDWKKNNSGCKQGDKCLFGTKCEYNKQNVLKNSCHWCTAPETCIRLWGWGCHKNSDCCPKNCKDYKCWGQN